MSVGVRGSFLDNSDIEELVNKHVQTEKVLSSICIKNGSVHILEIKRKTFIQLFSGCHCI